MDYIIFGGAFDPWTKAHAAIVTAAAIKFPGARIVIIPSIVSWHRKDKEPLFTESERAFIIKEWVRTSLPDDLRARVYVDTHEYALSPELSVGRGFVDTLRYFMESRSFSTNEEPNTFRFIVGADEWRIFDKWKNHEEILRLAKPIVVCRADENAPFGWDTLEIESKYADVSASKTRDSIVTDPCWYTIDSRYTTTNPNARAAWYLNQARFWADPEESLLKTPIFEVRRIASDIPGFRPICVVAPDWVCVLVKQGDEFLGVRQRRWGTGEEYDEFVTGCVDKGEEPRDAAVRELKEELGIVANATDLTPLGWLPTNPGFMSNNMYYYLLDLDKTIVGHEETSPDEHERLQPIKIKAENLHNRLSIRPALMLAGIALYDEAINFQELCKIAEEVENS